jgi:hypothetical protein
MMKNDLCPFWTSFVEGEGESTDSMSLTAQNGREQWWIHMLLYRRGWGYVHYNIHA